MYFFVQLFPTVIIVECKDESKSYFSNTESKRVGNFEKSNFDCEALSMGSTGLEGDTTLISVVSGTERLLTIVDSETALKRDDLSIDTLLQIVLKVVVI